MWDDWKKIVVFFAPLLLLLIGVGIYFVFRKTIRTRVRMAKQLRQDPDINDWLVVFNWSQKVLYVPTIVASLAAAILTWLKVINPMLVGGIWLGIFVLNFLVDEYEINFKIILIVVLTFGVLCLWLAFLGWFGAFFGWFRRIHVSLSPMGYLLIAVVFSLAVVISWIRGLFFYVALTPNYMNIQAGPTETGEQISHNDYSTRVDTGDFLERILGFGKIVITFRESRRAPIVLLVRGIGKKAAMLEAIRGALAFDQQHIRQATAAPMESTPPV